MLRKRLTYFVNNVCIGSIIIIKFLDGNHDPPRQEDVAWKIKVVLGHVSPLPEGSKSWFQQSYIGYNTICTI